MASDAIGVIDEAYQRMHATGPEYEGWLSNHGPMAAEAMARHGHGDAVGRWLDDYVKRLEEFPRGSGPTATTRCTSPNWPTGWLTGRPAGSPIPRQTLSWRRRGT